MSFLSSTKHATQNIGGAFNVGLKAGIGDFAGIGKSLPLNIGSNGGLATLGGLGVAGGYHVANNIDKIGEAAFKVGRGAKWLGGGFAESMSNTNRFVNPLGSIANGIKKVSNSLVRQSPVKEIWNAEKGVLETKGGGLKLSNWGKGMVGIGAVATGAYKAKEAFEQSRMGVQDNYITTSTPRVPSYKDNAGASGDLVFALNANRRG